MRLETEGVAFIHKDSSAGASLVELAESAGMRARLYGSVDDFLADADLERTGCVGLDDTLAGNVQERLLPARDRRKPQPFPIILLSMAAEKPARQRARDMGAAAFIREPVDGEALLDAIRWASGASNDSGSRGVPRG